MPADSAADDAIFDPLRDAAFGANPGLAHLRPARSGRDRWHRAVVLGGQGHFARARAELDLLGRSERPNSALRSFAASTEASLLRQLGWHARAAIFDGAALAAAGDGTSIDAVAARCDALTGLAADALGVGRLELGHSLLRRCETMLTAADGAAAPTSAAAPQELWRQHIRLHWVRAELALAAGDATAARTAAELAVAAAQVSASVRHVVKSRLILAAALCCEDDRSAAQGLSAAVVSDCRDNGLLPLLWAAAMLRSAIADDNAAGALVIETAQTIELRGGRFRKT
ncbi:hypothetical protein [Antrihabitans spumae]|uniref:Uncharacterized protein n=1 Tax=Antrihabitans spumae TaxID=3373370 RepID=A0ABW7K502_9NOCA